MKNYIDSDFLLDTPTAVKLFEDHASKMPIIDSRCHLIASDIAENRRFSNISELWLYDDQCRSCAMRLCGVDEHYITGTASDFEKFREFCRIMPLMIGNPIYHWSHLELRRYFDCNLTINLQNCEDIWRITSEKITEKGWGVKDYIISSNVRLLCTADDPADDLKYHKILKESDFGVQVIPTFCPEKGFIVDDRGITEYIALLSKNTGVDITDYESLCKAYAVSLDRFNDLGCKSAEIEIDDHIVFIKPDIYHANKIFKKALADNGVGISNEELSLWKIQMIRFFGIECVKRGWVLQIRCASLGITDNTSVSCLSALLKYLYENGALPKILIYPINSADNSYVSSVCKMFCKGDMSILQGITWRFNGEIQNELVNLANFFPLGNFLGVSTDSGSPISFPKHEYFRRVLCNIIGGWIERGLYPDYNAAADIVDRLSFYNVVNYFEFKIEI